MLARVLAQARDESIPMADNVFLDVAADAWYANGIGYLTNLGLVLGRGNCFFAPKELITRAEFAVLLVRVYSSMGGQTTGSAAFRFSDVSDRYWAAKEIQIAVAMGWFQENQADNFYPYDPITRAEGVVILNRMLGRTACQRCITDPMNRLKTFTDVSPDHWAWYDILEATNDHVVRVNG